MRIALVHYTYLPTIAGVELVMAEHARLFLENGHAVTIVADRLPDRADFPPPQLTAVALASLSAHSPLAVRAQRELELGGVGLAFEQAVEELLAELRPVFTAHDVVILHNVATMHFHLALTVAVGRLAEELARVRFIAWIHDLAACNPDYAPLPVHRPPWNALTRAHPRFTYIAVSALRREQFSALTAQPLECCRTIPNGVDATRILDLSPQTADFARRLGLHDREFVLIQPARLLRRKNIELTLHVVAALKAAGQSCAALITAPPEVQSGTSASYEQELRALHRELDLGDDVFFLHDYGSVDSRVLREIFALADALFFPSRQEGFGLPLLEAALHRLPIFCSDIEPLRGLLPRGVTTFALDTPPPAIAQLIIRTLADDAAHAARAHTRQHFSWSAIYRYFLSPLVAETKPLLPA